MSSPAQIIADNLAALPHPDGATRQLPGFSTKLLPDGLQEQVGKTSLEIGEAIIHLLSLNGYTVTDGTEQTPEPETPTIANVHCNMCDQRLMQLNIANPTKVLTNGRMFVEAMNTLTAECPHSG